MAVRLIPLYGDAVEDFPIVGSVLKIGRAADCDLRPTSPSASRHHCEIHVDEYRVLIRDLDSHNGTFVNGERVKVEHELNTGDQIAFGESYYEIQFDESVVAENVLARSGISNRRSWLDLGWRWRNHSVTPTA